MFSLRGEGLVGRSSVEMAGALASSYIPSSNHPLPSGKPRTCASAACGPAVRVLCSSITVQASVLTLWREKIFAADDRALFAHVGSAEEVFFSEQPTVSQDGTLSFSISGYCGTTAVDIVVEDLADVLPDGTLAHVMNIRIPIVIEPKSLMKKGRTALGRKAAPVAAPTLQTTGVAEKARRDKFHIDLRKATPRICAFREEPASSTPAAVAECVLLAAPVTLLRQWNLHAEYELISNASGTKKEANALLKRLKVAMEKREIVEVIVPIIDAAARLHFRLGGAENIATALRLARLRVNVVSSAIGLDLTDDGAANGLDVASAQRLAASHPDVAQLMIRVLVEGAHLFKLTGELPDALRYYKLATTLASTKHKDKPSGAQIPFLFATADVYMMAGDIPSSILFFEQARAHAEVSSKGSSVVAECEQQIAFAFTLVGQHKQAETALRRAHQIRRDQQNQTAIAEALLFEAACMMLRSQHTQACRSLARARSLLASESGDAAHFILAVADTMELLQRAVLATSQLLEHSDAYTPTAALQSPSHSIRALAAWLQHLCTPTAVADDIERVRADHAGVFGEGNMLSICFALTHSMVTTDAAAAHRTAGACVDQLSAAVNSTHKLLVVALELDAAHSRRLHLPEMAVKAAERMVWMLSQRGIADLDTPTVLRLSTLMARASTESEIALQSDECSALFSKFIERVGTEHGNYSPQVLPVLIDAAEMHYVRGDFSLSLELFAKALRIVDHRNLLYLVGPLFLPSWLLSQQELRDRNRLANERHPGTSSFVALAMLLQQIGLTHEASESLNNATVVLQQALATLEMGDLMHHQGALAVLVNLSRCHLALEQHATARLYIEEADELFAEHHEDYGGFKCDPRLVLARHWIDHTLRGVRAAEQSVKAPLVQVAAANSELAGLRMYC